MRRLFTPLLTATAAAGFHATVVLAQDVDIRVGAPPQGAFVISDEGGQGGMHIFHMAAPISVRELTRPEFSRRSMPVMSETLQLDKDQQLIVQTLLDLYISEFNIHADALKSMVKRANRANGPMAFGDFEEGEGGMPAPMIFTMGDGGTGEMAAITIAAGASLEGGEGGWVGGVPEGMAEGEVSEVRVAIALDTNEGGGQTGGEPAAEGAAEAATEAPSVQISMKDENGNELVTPEMLKAINEQIAKQIEEQMARVNELMRKRAEELAKEGPPPTREEIKTAALSFRAQRDALRAQLVADIQAILADAQLPGWAACDQEIRRIEEISHGQISGESVDVLAVCREMLGDTAVTAETEPVLTEYARVLNGALIERKRAAIDVEIDNITRENVDPEDESAIHSQAALMTRRVAVRNANLGALSALEQTLAPEAAAKVLDRGYRLGFPFVYGQTKTQRIFKQALDRTDLTPETRTTLETMHAEYEATLAQRNVAMREALCESEPREQERMREMMKLIQARIESGDHAEPPMPEPSNFDKLLESRNDYGRSTIARVKDVLGAEIFDQLPANQRGAEFQGLPGRMQRIIREGGAAPVKVEEKPEPSSGGSR